MKLNDDDVARVVGGIPADVRDVLKLDRRLCVAGGAVRSLVAGEPVSDYDVFGPDEGALNMAATTLLGSRFADRPREVRTDNAITVLTVGRTPVQFITRWRFAEPEAAIDSFDFTVAQAAVYYVGGWLGICSPLFYPDLAARRLRYTFPQRDEDACGSLLRVRKLVARGYHIPAESLAGTVARAVCGCAGLAVVHPDSGEPTPEGEVAVLLARRIREVDPLTLVDGVDVADGDHLEGA